jgi:hypothetical protein
VSEYFYSVEYKPKGQPKKEIPAIDFYDALSKAYAIEAANVQIVRRAK